MKAIKRANIVIVLLISALLCMLGGVVLTSCRQASDVSTLSTPKNLNLSEAEILSWDAVENAVGYTVEISGNRYETQTNSLDIFMLTVVPKTYSIQVMARGNGVDNKDSLWSSPLEYKLEFPEGLILKPISNYYSINVTDRNALKGKIVLPTSLDGLPIKLKNLNSCEQITGVIIPEGYETIEAGAFAGCYNLKRVALPSGLKKIDASAFYSCRSLMDVTIPDSVEEIGNLAFEGCTSLTSVTLSANVNSLGYGVFKKCHAVTSVTVDEANPVYKSDAGYIISRADNVLVQAFCCAGAVPEYVTAVGREAFAFTCFEEVALPKGVKTIGIGAFTCCINLKKPVLFDGIEEIGGFAFSGVPMPYVSIPRSVKKIGPGAFHYTYTRSFVLHDGIEEIGKEAFNGELSSYKVTIYTPLSYLEFTSRYSYYSTGIAVLYKCEIAYDDGMPYVASILYDPCEPLRTDENFTIIQDTDFTISNSLKFYYIPYRAGYVFAGWATEAGGEVVYAPVTREELNGDITYVAFTEEYNIPSGTVLYAVWLPQSLI